jgi:hypothetical protein
MPRGLVKNGGFVTVARDATVQAPADRSVKIASPCHQTFKLVAMRDAGDVLLDNGQLSTTSVTKWLVAR